ncbi:MAG: phosphopantetheine-binding protein [Burkholderiaceae bacterium]
MSTTSRIIAMLVKDFKADPDKLTPDASLEDLGIDSIGVAELLFNIEDEFGLKLPDVPMDLATFEDVVLYVDGQIAAQTGTAAGSELGGESQSIA